MLDLVDRDLRLGRDDAERQDPVRRRPLEDGLDQGEQADLLAQERKVLLQEGLRA